MGFKLVKLLDPAVVGLSLIVAVLLIPQAPENKSNLSLLDKSLPIDRELHETVFALLETGRFEKDDLVIDGTELQTITLDNGKLEFSPPLRVKWRFISTTVTDVSLNTDENSIFIDIDSSPIDVNVVPKD